MGRRGGSLDLAMMFLIVAPAFILFGYNQAGIGGLLTIPNWVKTFPSIDTSSKHLTAAAKSHNSTIQGVVVATFVLGALTGALSCIWTGDVLGRRKQIFIGAICTLTGEAICCSSFKLPQFIVGRTTIGLGVGILSATVPVWQSECSGSKNRGKHVVLDGLFICVGYTLESWINLGFFQIKTGSLSWRIPLALPMIVSIILGSSIWFMPESPRWLVRMGRVQEASSNLAALKDLPLDHHLITAEIGGIEYALEETSGKAASLKDIFHDNPDKIFYRFMLCIITQFWQQMSGSNLISVYAPIIFQQGLGVDSETSRILAAGALTFKFLSSFVAFFTIDRFGRRALFMISGVGMTLCMTSLAIAGSFPRSNFAASVSSVLFVFLFNFFVPIGFLGCNFLYCTEVAPLKLRVAMSSVSTANHWLWNFVVALVTPVAIDKIGWKYFLLFAAIGGTIPVSVFFYFPETMGQSLEQIDVSFRESKSIRDVVRMSQKLSAGQVHEILQEKESGSESHVEDVEK